VVLNYQMSFPFVKLQTMRVIDSLFVDCVCIDVIKFYLERPNTHFSPNSDSKYRIFEGKLKMWFRDSHNYDIEESRIQAMKSILKDKWGQELNIMEERLKVSFINYTPDGWRDITTNNLAFP
jgi:hypothetical protein